MTADPHATHSHVAAKDRMNLPHRRILYRDSLEKNILTAVWLNELWPEVMACSEHSFLDRHAALNHLQQNSAGFSLVRSTFFPTILGPAIPWPPRFRVGLSVECAVTCTCDVLLLEGINER